jgi:hypothetical protein
MELTSDIEARVFTIGCFRIDIDEVKVVDFKAMRNLLPKTEYKLLKNRKCARVSRFRRKEETIYLQAENRCLKQENAKLRRQLGLPVANELDTFSDALSENESSSTVHRYGQASISSEITKVGRSEEIRGF